MKIISNIHSTPIIDGKDLSEEEKERFFCVIHDFEEETLNFFRDHEEIFWIGESKVITKNDPLYDEWDATIAETAFSGTIFRISEDGETAEVATYISKEEVFCFLDDLRETGITNMFGAASYIEDMYEIRKKEAKELLIEWMETFSERHK